MVATLNHTPHNTHCTTHNAPHPQNHSSLFVFRNILSSPFTPLPSVLLPHSSSLTQRMQKTPRLKSYHNTHTQTHAHNEPQHTQRRPLVSNHITTHSHSHTLTHTHTHTHTQTSSTDTSSTTTQHTHSYNTHSAPHHTQQRCSHFFLRSARPSSPTPLPSFLFPHSSSLTVRTSNN